MVTFKQRFYVWLVQVIGSLRRQAFGLAVLACAAVAYAFPSAFIEWRGVKLMSLVVPAIQIIMFGMGTTLSAADFVRVGKRPWAVAVGVFLQFLVMPFMGFLLAKGFGFSGELAAGCVLVGSVAGGTASNVVAFLAKADVALSVTMTCCSTLLSPFVTPLAMKVLAGCFVDIDAMAMMVDIMKIVIVPIVAGGIVHALLKRQFDAHKVIFDRILSILSMTGICFTILVLTAPSRDTFASAGVAIVAAAVIHNIVGYLSGYWLTRLVGRFTHLGEAEARTVAIEVGMQNSGMAGALSVKVLNSAVAALPATIFSIWMNFSGSVLASWWGAQTDRCRQRSRLARRIACLMGVMALACAGAEGPADEMEAVWIAQDGPIPTHMTHAAWRAEKLARRAERLKPVAAMSKTWAYCRHYVLGRRSTFLHLSELSDAFEQRSYRVIGSSLCLAEYQPDGLWKETTLLSSKTGCYRDVDVSPDGKRLRFSFKASDRGDDFHLYAMDLATREVKQLTFGLGAADIEGCFLPDGRILFNSTRCGQIVDCWLNEVFNLYRCEADGSKITRITYDQVNNYFPTLADDGRVLYMRWEYNDRGQIYTQPVFSMNPDGTYQRALYGGNSYFPNCILQARMVPGSPLFFALGTGHHSWEPGELMRFDPREGREETEGCWELAPLRRAQFVKRDGNFGQQGAIYCFPYPVNEESVVITHLRRTKGVSPDRDFGLVWTDVNGAREVLVAQDGKISCGRPVPVRARKLPARSSVRPDESLKTGTITIADVYRGESMKGVARGTVKSMRVVSFSYRPAGVGRSVVRGPGGFAMNATPPGLGNSTWLVKKVLGEVPVAEDGSVAVNLPARTPFYLQLLDEKGRMVQTMRSWTVLQPGEVASCVGCHESLNDAPDYRMEHHALARATLPPAKDGFSFPREVQPILDRRCVRCHNPMNDRIPDLTSVCVRDPQAKRWWTRSYLSLTHARLDDKALAKKYGNNARWWETAWVGDCAHPMLNWIDNGSTASLVPPNWRGSRKSRLFTDKLDKGHAPGLTDTELRTLACWVDLGVPFCGAYDERADWTPDDYALWNRGLLRRARFRTDGEPDGDAAYAWSTNTSVLVGNAELRTNRPPPILRNCLLLDGRAGRPEVFEIAGGVLDLTTNRSMMQIGCYPKLENAPHESCQGIVNQTGGEVRMNNFAVLGRYPGDVGWYNQTGGSFHMLNPQTCVYVGEEGEGHLRVGGTGYFSTPHLSMGRAATCRNCSVTLEGDGRLVLGDITVKGAVGATVNFNGGTLATYEGMRRCVPFIAPTVATRIQSGGARIEVGLDAWAELPGVLAEDSASRGGGLTKAGYGTLVLLGTNTYTGATRVEGGCLLVKDAGTVGRSASIHVAGEAKLGFFGENLSAAHAALAGKVTWAPGSALLIDTRNGPVRISGRDLLGASVVEKTGANDLVLTSPPVDVGEIRVREGKLRTSEPGLIPPAVKVLSLGGQYLNNVASTSK